MYNKRLNAELATASCIKSRVNRQSVIQGLKAVKSELARLQATPSNGLFVFAGLVSAGDDPVKKKMTVTSIEPPHPVAVSLYRCDSSFHTAVLEQQLHDSERFGFVVVDGSSALIAAVQGDHISVLQKLSTQLTSKTRRGGSSSNRYQQIRQNERQHWIQRVCESVTSALIDAGTAQPGVQGLVLAGSADLKEVLAAILDQRLARLVLATVTVAYSGMPGLHEAIQKTSEQVQSHGLQQQERVLSEFFTGLQRGAHHAELVAYGLEFTLACLEQGAVKTLMLADSSPLQRMLFSDGSFAVCTSVPPDNKLDVASQTPFIDHLLEDSSALQGAQLVLVSESTPSGSMFARGFQGVGALLHFAPNVYVHLSDDDSDELDEDFNW